MASPAPPASLCRRADVRGGWGADDMWTRGGMPLRDADACTPAANREGHRRGPRPSPPPMHHGSGWGPPEAVSSCLGRAKIALRRAAGEGLPTPPTRRRDRALIGIRFAAVGYQANPYAGLATAMESSQRATVAVTGGPMKIIYSDPGRPVAREGPRTGRRQPGGVGPSRASARSRCASGTTLSLAPADRRDAYRQPSRATRRVDSAAPRRPWLYRVILLILALFIYLAIGRDLVQMALASGRAEQTQLRRDFRALGKTTSRDAALGAAEEAGDGAPRQNAGATGRPSL
jgi:hypothetical protein